jgi:hypothetical protein
MSTGPCKPSAPSTKIIRDDSRRRRAGIASTATRARQNLGVPGDGSDPNDEHGESTSPSGPAPEEGDGAGPPDVSAEDAHEVLRKVARLIDVDPRGTIRGVQQYAGAAWNSVTREEPRIQVTIAVVVAIGLMLALPERVTTHPRWVLPTAAALLLIGVFVAKSARLERRTRALRIASLALIGVMSIANATSAGRLIVDLVRGEGIRNPTTLLLTGAAIWFTNVIVFGLWYWEFDRGGPVERALGTSPFPDFLFPQMTSPELAPPEWEPGFVDYLYVSFTNATAFSPTDVMPMTRWAKLTMLTQSTISVITVALVIARAVNILKVP